MPLAGTAKQGTSAFPIVGEPHSRLFARGIGNKLRSEVVAKNARELAGSMQVRVAPGRTHAKRLASSKDKQSAPQWPDAGSQ